jgi:hypothetical protein
LHTLAASLPSLAAAPPAADAAATAGNGGARHSWAPLEAALRALRWRSLGARRVEAMLKLAARLGLQLPHGALRDAMDQLSAAPVHPLGDAAGADGGVGGSYLAAAQRLEALASLAALGAAPSEHQAACLLAAFEACWPECGSPELLVGAVRSLRALGVEDLVGSYWLTRQEARLGVR